MPDRFAVQTTTNKPLADGDWIELRDELTYAEEKKLAGGALRQTGVDEEGAPLFRVDLAAYGVELLSAWLADWSFTRSGADGKRQRVPLTRDAIAALTPETGNELEDAIQEHIAGLQAKKAPKAETTTPTATSAASAAPK
jgi:hypothetical protein